MSRNIEFRSSSESTHSIVPARVDMEQTPGSASYREATNVIQKGSSALPTAGAVYSFVKDAVRSVDIVQVRNTSPYNDSVSTTVTVTQQE